MPEQIVVTPRNGQWLVTTRGVVLHRMPTVSRAIRKAVKTAARFTSHEINAEVLIEKGGAAKPIWQPGKSAFDG